MAEKDTKSLIFDLDLTLCTKKEKGQTYADVEPIQSMIDLVNKYYDEGFEIIINTARHMVTCDGDIELIKQRVGQITIDWLEKYRVKYHKLIWGKPYGECYCDDKAIRPNELLALDKIKARDNLENYLKDENDLTIVNKSLKYILNKNYVYQWYYVNEKQEKIVFYVGKGKKLRAWDTKGRNEIFHEIYNKYICDVEIIKTFDNGTDAYKHEIELQHYYWDKGQCIANLNDFRGRESHLKGTKITLEHREKCSIAIKKVMANKDCSLSEDTKRKISIKAKERFSNPDFKKKHSQKLRGRKFSDDAKKNISKVRKNERNSMAKLNEEKVKEICVLLNQNMHPKDIAVRFNVAEITIHRIKGRKSWTNVSDIYLKI